MIRFDGFYYDGRSSKPAKVSVEFADGVLTLAGTGQTQEKPLNFILTECRIMPALGDGQRAIRLPQDFGHIETNAGAAVLELERQEGVNRGFRLLHLMESRWRLALVGLLVLGLTAGVFVRWGVPLIADAVARGIPDHVLVQMTNEAMGQLDKVFLKPSALDGWRKERIEKLYSDFCLKVGVEEPTLVFRSINGTPNAFALPRGIIVLTDSMVDFVGSDDELLSVLAHETAHIEERHVIRQLLRNTGLYLLISLSLGDASSILSATATLPTMLLQRGYGRDFESEADLMGGRMLLKSGRSVKPMADFMERIAAKYPDTTKNDLFSTHPSTLKRIERAKELEAQNPR